MIPRLVVDFDTADAVPEALMQHEALITSTAARLSRKDLELENDLIQEAAILLWELDPTRFDAGDRWFVEQELVRRMRRVRKREWRAAGRDNRVWVSEL